MKKTNLYDYQIFPEPELSNGQTINVADNNFNNHMMIARCALAEKSLAIQLRIKNVKIREKGQ